MRNSSMAQQLLPPSDLRIGRAEFFQKLRLFVSQPLIAIRGMTFTQIEAYEGGDAAGEELAAYRVEGGCIVEVHMSNEHRVDSNQ